MTDQPLPIIDITTLFESDEIRSTGEALFKALSNIGFAIVVGHGVPMATIDGMRTAVSTIFDTPRDILARQTVAKGNYRGFVPLGYFTPNSGKGKADQYEAWKLHTETAVNDPICHQSNLYAPNRWPDINVDVKTPILAYWAEMERVSQQVLKTLSQQLGIDDTYILSCLSNPLTNMTLLNYPPLPPQSEDWGIHPHKDFNLITLLAHDPVGGLEVRNRDGNWISAKCPPDGIVMNVGDMLELWSGGRLMSTPHRVTNKSGQARQSFPYFSVPRFNVWIEPLLPPIAGYERQPLHVGDSSADIWYSNWPDTISTDPAQELGNFE
ncbi:MAG: 2OG-Fe(II) oxygenase family protein [Chloroflexota bacterium]